MDLNVWGHHHSLSMGGHHAVDDLAGANPGIEMYPSATYNIKPFSECPTAQSAVAVLEAIKQLARDRWQ